MQHLRDSNSAIGASLSVFGQKRLTSLELGYPKKTSTDEDNIVSRGFPSGSSPIHDGRHSNSPIMIQEEL